MQRFLIALVVFALAGCATRKAVEPVRVAAKPPAAQRVPEASKPEPRTVPEPTVFEATGSDVQQFIAEVAQRRGIPASDIEKLIAQGRHQPRIIEIMTRPAEGVLRWYEYSEKLVTAERMDAGARFWNENRATLEQVQQRTGVDAAYIVAIIGIETSYGRNKGSWRVLDALLTLGFDYPPRAKFFKSELEQFVLLTREEKLDPTAVLGSYAGAMGGPQFMPSSYRNYALDGDGDGRRDLFDNWNDVIASVANYFAVHGWQRGAPVLTEASAPADLAATLDRRNLDLKDTVGTLRMRNVVVDGKFDDATPVILLPAELRDRPNVRVGFRNFYVITRYNRSILYAMAVNDLATAIRQQTAAAPTTTPAAAPSPQPIP